MSLCMFFPLTNDDGMGLNWRIFGEWKWWNQILKTEGRWTNEPLSIICESLNKNILRYVFINLIFPVKVTRIKRTSFGTFELRLQFPLNASRLAPINWYISLSKVASVKDFGLKLAQILFFLVLESLFDKNLVFSTFSTFHNNTKRKVSWMKVKVCPKK